MRSRKPISIKKSHILDFKKRENRLKWLKKGVLMAEAAQIENQMARVIWQHLYGLWLQKSYYFHSMELHADANYKHHHLNLYWNRHASKAEVWQKKLIRILSSFF